ncbi:hypothetical protein [Priestia megaterium]|uniref:Uncharacterized protein n=1 Tax=Priestia megaterium TaxID=1404 RepID=A0A6M6E5L3_PRIMG|nr:hypothetical protein [Priestia megaterium]QJX80419.1 hypothetical protein FDZ14_30495 [Priestia megaterium]
MNTNSYLKVLAANYVEMIKDYNSLSKERKHYFKSEVLSEQEKSKVIIEKLMFLAESSNDVLEKVIDEYYKLNPKASRIPNDPNAHLDFCEEIASSGSEIYVQNENGTLIDATLVNLSCVVQREQGDYVNGGYIFNTSTSVYNSKLDKSTDKFYINFPHPEKEGFEIYFLERDELISKNNVTNLFADPLAVYKECEQQMVGKPVGHYILSSI